MASNDLAQNQSNLLANSLDSDSLPIKDFGKLSKLTVSPPSNFSFLDVSLISIRTPNYVITSSKKKQQLHSIGNDTQSKTTKIRRELLFNKSETEELQHILESLNSKPKIRTRVKLTDAQQNALEEEFKMDRYPVSSKIENIASELNLTFQKVSIWFQNKRARFKKAQPSQRMQK